MKKIAVLILAILFFAGPTFAQGPEEKRDDPSKPFYVGNSYYEKRDYRSALAEYLKVLDQGFESGNLYYNTGNCFFKMGKAGMAILYYEKAKRMIPQDKDLQANLAYAKSLVGGPDFRLPATNPVSDALKRPFIEFNLNALAISALIFYLVVVVILALFITNPFFAKKIWLLLLISFCILTVNLGAFAIRYYDEEMLKRAIIIQKDADCKYEPIDKSTTYYKLQEGDEVIVLTTRSGWCQIRRLDGKTAWVKKEALEEI